MRLTGNRELAGTSPAQSNQLHRDRQQVLACGCAWRYETNSLSVGFGDRSTMPQRIRYRVLDRVRATIRQRIRYGVLDGVLACRESCSCVCRLIVRYIVNCSVNAPVNFSVTRSTIIMLFFRDPSRSLQTTIVPTGDALGCSPVTSLWPLGSRGEALSREVGGA